MYVIVRRLVTELTKPQEKEKLLQFLFGLDITVFGTIPSSILGKDPLTNVNQAYSKTVQQEQVQKMDKVEDRGEAMAFAIKAVRNTYLRKLTCLVCHKFGHDATDCFTIIDHPDWWVNCGNKGRSGGMGASSGRGIRGREVGFLVEAMVQH